jgi:transposase
MPAQSTYRRQVLDHLGLVAGMFDALGMGAVIDQAPHQHPEMRDLTVGEAGTAMVLNGLGLIHQALYLGPRFFQHTPTSRLLSPRMAPAQRNDDALGRALETLDADGVTDLSSLMAATAAERRGLAPRLTPLDRTSVHVDGRYNSGEAPEAQVVQRTRGDSRDHRPDFNHVLLERIVEQQAGIPLLMTPRSGNSREAQHVGEVVRPQVPPLQTT